MNTQEEKPMKLISMVDFVLEQEFAYGNEFITADRFAELVCRYANLLKQPLTLGMLIPCVYGDEFNYSKHGNTKEYQEAKDKILFEGFMIQEVKPDPEYSKSVTQSDSILNIFWFSNITQQWIISRGLKTIEDLCQYRLELTKTAKNQIFQ